MRIFLTLNAYKIIYGFISVFLFLGTVDSYSQEWPGIKPHSLQLYTQDSKPEAKVIIVNPTVKVECLNVDIDLCAKILTQNSSSGWSQKDIFLAFISFLALVISLGNNFYNWSKDNKTRLRSINDDFWIRKIVSPISIEPLMKDILEVVANLPNDCSKNVTNEIYKEFITKYHPKIQQLSITLQALKLIDLKIYTKSNASLIVIEDLILEYCGDNQNNSKHPNGGPTNPKNEASDKIIANMMEILILLKSYQTKQV